MEDRIRIDGITKTFGHTVANNHVTLAIKPGSIHGIAGENGSGKSTLSSIICGMQKADSGSIYKDGKPFSPVSPIAANEEHVAMVVQELGIIGMLPPAINMFLGKTGQFSKGGIVDIRKLTEAAKAQFEKWKLPLVPLTGMTEALSIEQRKILELARALTAEPDFLILDEISQALSQDNREILYRFMKEFISQGRSIMLITHDLEEMMEVCDTISVLRDGAIINTKPTSEYTLPMLQKEMIGREVSGNYYRDDQAESYQEELVLKAEHLTCSGQIQDINFELHKGEILAICGLSDAGIHSVGKVMFGLEENVSGEIIDVANGKKLKTPQDVLEAGGAYLSKDRDSDGLMLKATIKQNLALPNVKALAGTMGFLSPQKVDEMSRDAVERFEVKCESDNSMMSQLSGGNKQKVNLSRWLVQDLRFIILDCPTRGVDIGVKAYIYNVLKQAKKDGMGIIMISDELSEAQGMADKILVMRDHAQSGILCRSEGFGDEKLAEVML